MDVEMIDTASALKAFIAGLPEPTQEPNLYVDLEGNNLSRSGTLSLVTIFVEPRHTVHLIDVTTLGKEAFATSNDDGKTLQQVLESEHIVKVFFDIRNDSDALFNLFGVRVAGIEDIQLMEVAARTSSKRLLNGLAKCIERDAPIGFAEKQKWSATKNQGHRLFDPARGGSYAVFDQRPLSTEMQDYCVQDVLHMPGLREKYKSKLGAAWWAKIQEETAARIQLSQSANFNGKGRHMAEGPAGWQFWRPGIAQDSEVLKTTGDSDVAPNRRTASDTASLAPAGLDEGGGRGGRIFGGGRGGFGGRVADHADNHSDDDLCDNADFEDGYRDGYDSEEESNGFADYTACDSYSCGYCGKCSY